MRWIGWVCLLLSACGPVLLVEDDEPTPPPASPELVVDSGTPGPANAGSSAAVGEPDPSVPRALIRVRATDCGSCFELAASGTGGQAPYQFAWEDGSTGEERRVCPNGSLEVSVIVQDATAARSSAYVTRLEVDADASCPSLPVPVQALCVTNASFEGAPAANPGVPEMFDAAPWTACTNPPVDNTPDIGTQAATVGDSVPMASDGETFLALSATEQASQPLCEGVEAGAEVSFMLDLAFADPGAGLGAAPQAMSFEVWGGVAAECVQHERLWTSPALETTWTTHCIKLQPTEFMDQITLRAVGDAAALVPAFILADNLIPVDDCP